MGWVKLDDQFSRHPKVLRAGPLAGWLHICALNYCAQYLTDGFIPAAAVNALADYSSLKEDLGHVADGLTGCDFVPSLVRHGIWAEVQGGYQIHDYLDYNPSRDEVLKRRRADAERKANPDRVTEDSGRSRNGVVAESNAPVPRPRPVPGPIPKPEESTTAAAQFSDAEKARIDEVHEVLGEFDLPREPQMWRTVLDTYGSLDLRTEAIKQADWLRRGRKRTCSAARYLEWLNRASVPAEGRQPRAWRPSLTEFVHHRSPEADSPFEPEEPRHKLPMCQQCGKHPQDPRANSRPELAGLCQLCHLTRRQEQQRGLRPVG